MTDALIYADTVHSAELRHELPARIIDPFLYVEHERVPYAVLSQLDAEGASAARPDLRIITPEALGLDDLLAAGTDAEEALVEIAVRACRELAVETAVVPPRFPLGLADRLRAAASSFGWAARRSPSGGESSRRPSSRECAAPSAQPRPVWVRRPGSCARQSRATEQSCSRPAAHV